MKPRALSTYCCSITPFAADGSLDEAALRAHFERLGEAGVGVYAAGSSPGEGYALSEPEVRRSLEIAVQTLRGRVPVRAMGVEPRHAQQMIRYVKLAAECGVDAVQIYSLDMGHGGRPDSATLERYLRAAIEASSLPCVVSSHHFVGYTLEPALMRALCDDYAHLIGFNVTSPDLPYHVRVIEALAGRAEVHVGGPMHALSAIALGANGFLSTEANYAPRLCHALIDCAGSGDLAGAQSAYARIMALMAGTSAVPGMSVRAIKAALAELGHCAPQVRDPHLPIAPEESARMGRLLERLGIRAGEAKGWTN